MQYSCVYETREEEKKVNLGKLIQIAGLFPTSGQGFQSRTAAPAIGGDGSTGDNEGLVMSIFALTMILGCGALQPVVLSGTIMLGERGLMTSSG
jgi:hypothetical protein